MDATKKLGALMMFMSGLAPSQVDGLLGLREGMTRSLVVQMWAEDKQEAMPAKAA